jgi:Glyoxalase-like domain
MAFPIDHLFTVTTDREAARAALAGMGFQLTERGEHPGRGTSNHLMFFGRCYWELLAVDEPGPASALLGRATTLMGCALRTGDAARDAAAAARLGASAGATESVTRPVRVDGQWHTARFTIAPLAPAVPADVHFFFCQHLTPELVWPHERVVHPNGAFRLKALYAVGPSGSSAERTLGVLLGAGGGDEPQIEYLSADSWRRRFGMPSTSGAEAPPHLAGLAFQVDDLDRCAAYLTKQRIPHRPDGREIQVLSDAVAHPIVFAA